MINKYRNQEGIIPIAIVLTIFLAGIGGVAYYLINNGIGQEAEDMAIENSKEEETEQEKLANAEEALRLMQEEIDNLKNTNTNSVEQISDYTTSDIVSQNKKYIVSVMCENSSGWVYGSGIIIGKSTDGVVVLTNDHIVENANNESADLPPCIIGDSLGLGEYYYGQPIFYPSIASLETMELIDFAFIKFKEPVSKQTFNYNDITGEYELKEGTPKTSLLSIDTFPTFCSQELLKAGEDLVILGYPLIGGDSIYPGVPDLKLITTEGIISNDVYSSNNYFVTSAKIEQGNSGGAAFLKSNNCLAGMPTYVKIGSVESLGRLINLPKLFSDYLSKIVF